MKPRNKGGRPPFQPTDEQRKTVTAMAGYGIPQDGISKVIGIDLKTLRKHFREELDKGEVVATSKVAESLYKQATGGNVAAAIFWMKARAGWSEKIRHEVDIDPHVEDLTDEQLATLALNAIRGGDRAAKKANGSKKPDSIH